MFDIYSNARVTRFCDIAQLKERREAGVLLRIFRSEQEKNCGIKCGITAKGTDRVIGVCGMSWYQHNRSALLSYDLNEEYWNRGFMTEAAGVVVE